MIIVTEKNNQNTKNIDLQDGEGIARLINAEDQKVAGAVAKIVPQIGVAIDEIAKRLRFGGRMAYFGSGTSGRIGILDASEMPPTFGVAPSMIQGYISGGDKAIRDAVENAEDNAEFALADIKMFKPTAKDVVVAISASGNPQYAVEALRLAKKSKALCIAVTSNPDAKLKEFADIFLAAEVGPEAVTGSSRMKSGTAQKLILNMLSTGAMIRLGKTYQNYMIDLQMNNYKLKERAIRFVSEITGVNAEIAAQILTETGSVKIACVMLLKKCDKKTAIDMLSQNEGILRRVI